MVADTYSTDGIGVLLMGTGNDNNTWGANANTSVFQIIMDALANVLTSAVTGGTLTLSGTPPPAAASQVRYAALKFTGILSSNQIVQVPNLNKWWLVCNATSGAFTLKFKTPSGSASTAIPQNSGWQMVRCTGSDVIEVWPFNTNQIQMPDGTAALPSISFLTDPTSGYYRIGAGNIGLSLSGTKMVDFSTAGVTITGALSVSSGATIAGGLVVNGGQTFQHPTFFGVDLFRSSTGANSDFLGSLNFTGKDAAANFTTYGRFLPQIVDATDGSEDGQIYVDIMTAGTLTPQMVITGTGIFTTNNVEAGGSIIGATLSISGNATITGNLTTKVPTVQRFTSGSGTCTPTSGTVRWLVTMCGPGGGGGRNGTSTGNGSASAGNTSFGSWTAIKGSAGNDGNTQSGGAGGTGGATGTGTLVARFDGGDGEGSFDSTVTCPGGSGGGNAFGGSGRGVRNGTGTSGKANTGAGGAGEGMNNGKSGCGGGAGEWVQFWVNSPTATSYSVAAGGAGATNAGSGAAGYVQVIEYYS